MTATISFEVDKKDDVLKIPNSALRFYPDIEYVRQEDRGLLDGTAAWSPGEGVSDTQSAAETTDAHRKRDRRHVWVADGGSLRAIEVLVGIMDGRFSECVSGELKEGDKLVTGIIPK
jgi:HlyD family secretion protein